MMKMRPTRWMLAGLMCAVAAQACFAVGLAGGRHKRNARAEVARIDAQWKAAMLSNDAPAMDKLLAEDYLGIASNGLVLTRAQQLDRMRAHETVLERAETSDLKIKLIGSLIAIVTSQVELDGTLDGHAVHGRFRSTRVYQRSGGVWRLTRFESTQERGRGKEQGAAVNQPAG